MMDVAFLWMLSMMGWLVSATDRAESLAFLYVGMVPGHDATSQYTFYSVIVIL